MEESVEQSKLKKELGEYIGRYNEEKMLREETERDMANLKKRYAMQSGLLTESAVDYISNVIITARCAMGGGAILSFIAFFFILSIGAHAEVEGLEPPSILYYIGTLLSGIVCLLITVFMPNYEAAYDMLDEYRKSQIADRLYDAGLLDEQQEDDDIDSVF